MMTQMLGRRIDARMRTIGRKGSTRKMSVIRMRRVSTSLPKKPANSPTMVPRPTANTAASPPTINATWVP